MCRLLRVLTGDYASSLITSSALLVSAVCVRLTYASPV